ncbi:MAG: T9SS type A sorting domain-containing protein [Calditrichaceae bacterium]|nr:T9SS type A sorting domain-containing protein [Calditrichaceae bacterium]MBN2708139.1 T9SS type A sorting domain-containing protein [Calditrichaceae bacterium]
MKKKLGHFIVLIFATTGLIYAQVSQIVKDFENSDKGTDGFYIAGGDIVTGLSQNINSLYGGILETQINVDSGGTAIIQVDNFNQFWTASKEGAQFLTIDVFVPEDFPDSSIVQLWEMDQNWKGTFYSPSNLDGGRTMAKGFWNTFIFEIKREYQNDPDNYNLWNVNMGLEIKIYNSWTGSILIDNVTLWSISMIIDDFEQDMNGWASSGEVFSTLPTWVNHVQYGGVVEMAVANNTEKTIAGDISLSNISLGWTDSTVSAVIMAMDIYIPEDFPDSSYFRFYNIDQLNQSLKRTIYSPSTLDFGEKSTLIKKGVWNTIAFEVKQQYAVDTVNYFPWAQIQAGLEVNIDTVYSGTLYIDNLRLYSKETLLPISPSKLATENSVVFDFEDPAEGESGITIGWGEAVASLNRIDHPDYGGILEAVVSVDGAGSFSTEVSSFDNGWTEENEGPAFLSVDVFVPENFPDNSYIKFWQMDETKLQQKFNLYSPSFLDGGRPIKKGAWNTLIFDIRRFDQISGDTYNPANPVSMGIEVQMNNDFTGSIYFDNFALLGACRTNGSKDFDETGDIYGLETADTEVIKDIKLVNTISGGVLSFNISADTVLNGTITFNDFNNLWIQESAGPALLITDIYIPADFPDSSFIQIWEMDKTHWNWQALLYGPIELNIAGWHRTNLIKKGEWNTIMFDIRQSYQSNPDLFFPWQLVSMGFQFAMSKAWSGTIYVDNFCFVDTAAHLSTGIAMEENLTMEFNLAQNYPNPFNPSTKIQYTVGTIHESNVQNVNLSIYNTLGQKVVTLVNKKQSAGNYQVEWNAGSLSSGVYLYRLKTDQGFVQTRKLILLK